MRAGAVPWPAEFVAHYRASGYWRDRALGRLPQDWAARFGDRVALVDGDVRLSYRELAERVEAAAGRLHRAGLREGDNMLIQLPNSHQFVVLVLACARIGTAPVLMLPAHRERELLGAGRLVGAVALASAAAAKGFDLAAQARQVAAQLPHCGLLLIGDGAAQGTEFDLDDVVGPAEGPDGPRPGAVPDPDPTDVALFLLSGGTTGMPKLIARTHNDYEYNLRRSAQVCEFDESTVYLAALPAAHNFVLGSPGILGTLHSGGRAVLVRSPAPAGVFAAIARHGVTHTAAVPTVLRRWLAHCRDSGAAPRGSGPLRVIQVGGERLEPEYAAYAAELLGARIQQVFGMAEGLLNFTRPRDPAPVLLGTQGRPMSPGDEVEIVDEDGKPVPPGVPGELLTRGPYTPRGYFAAPEHNRQAFTEDGWLRTGDLVCQHPDGNLSVVGRIKDVVNRGGEKISADEIEGVIDELPEVAAVAVVPAPDPAFGECVAAFVVPRAGARLDLAGLSTALRALGLAEFKLPEHLYLVDSLPRTAVGKIDKQALRIRLVEQAAHPECAAAGAADS